MIGEIGEAPSAPRPGRSGLALLVGRITTLKLAYWFGLTAVELALPLLYPRPFSDRFPLAVGAAALLTVVTVAAAFRAARAIDRRVGRLERSPAAVLVAFVAATVVASPASIPLLLIERQRSLEGCGPAGTCHGEAVALWALTFLAGMVLIPAVFAASLRPAEIRPVERATPT